MRNFKHLSKATLSRNMDQLIKRSALAESATKNALRGPSVLVSGGLMLGKQVQAIVQKRAAVAAQ
jgi:hypothetical protein